MAGLAWIGLFSDEKAPLKGNPLDSLCATLEKKMQYEPGERGLYPPYPQPPTPRN